MSRGALPVDGSAPHFAQTLSGNSDLVELALLVHASADQAGAKTRGEREMNANDVAQTIQVIANVGVIASSSFGSASCVSGKDSIEP